MAALSPGTKAPPFQLRTIDGKMATSALASGQLGILAFFKESCPTCQLAMPFLERLFGHHKSDDQVRILSIAQEGEEGARRFIDAYKIAMPMALDESPYRISAQYRLTHVPTVFLVKEDGLIDETIVGFVKKDYEKLARKISDVTRRAPWDLFAGAAVPELRPG